MNLSSCCATHSPALAVALPLLGAMLVMVISAERRPQLRGIVFFLAAALGAFAAINAAGWALATGACDYVFGAGMFFAY